MTNTFKIGDKFLLPIEISDFGNAYGYLYGRSQAGCEVPIYPLDVEALIPASTLTDLQAENARLRTALTDIVDYVEQSNPWDTETGFVYGIAVKALGGGE